MFINRRWGHSSFMLWSAINCDRKMCVRLHIKERINQMIFIEQFFFALFCTTKLRNSANNCVWPFTKCIRWSNRINSFERFLFLEENMWLNVCIHSVLSIWIALGDTRQRQRKERIAKHTLRNELFKDYLWNAMTCSLTWIRKKLQKSEDESTKNWQLTIKYSEHGINETWLQINYL